MRALKGFWEFLIIFVLAAGVAGYLYFSKSLSTEPSPEGHGTGLQDGAELHGGAGDGYSVISVFYPSKGGLQMEQRRVPSSEPRAKSAVKEFFKGPVGGTRPFVPGEVTLLGMYNGEDGILYVDLSDEARRDFEGDAAYEFLLLKGLYETLMPTSEGAKDIKLLIDGREAETIGGHISIARPLGESLSETMETKKIE